MFYGFFVTIIFLSTPNLSQMPYLIVKFRPGSYHASTTITAQVIKGFKGGRKDKYYMTFAIAMCIQQHRMFTFNFYSSFLPLVTEQLISATD